MLETPRLLLRPCKLADASDALPLYSDVEVTRFIGGGRTTTDTKKIEAIISRFMDHERQFGFSPRAIIEKSSGSLVGICGLHHFNAEGEVEIGFRIARAAWGKGYATEAGQASLDEGFEKYDLKRVIALTHTKNIASKKVIEKIGIGWERSLSSQDEDQCEKDLYAVDFWRHSIRGRLPPIKIRTAHENDVLSLACLASNIQTEQHELPKIFEEEIALTRKRTGQRLLLVAYNHDGLIAFAGSRYYQPQSDPSPYDTVNPLPEGWYLKGVSVRSDYHRQGIATKLTEMRLRWLKERTDSAYLFFDREAKVATPMYGRLGFREISRDWTFIDPKNSNRGILLKNHLTRSG